MLTGATRAASVWDCVRNKSIDHMFVMFTWTSLSRNGTRIYSPSQHQVFIAGKVRFTQVKTCPIGSADMVDLKGQSFA